MEKISLVISVYNEEEVLNAFYEETHKILKTINCNYEMIFVNDGSVDKSPEVLKDFALKNTNVKVINFSRNFGHEAAMIAGIDHSSGDGIICMDADLQHPPCVIPRVIEKFEKGVEIVNMVRTKNPYVGVMKRTSSSLFYKTINVISPIKFQKDSSDFFAITANVAAVLKKDYREKTRFLRGLVQCVGFHKDIIEFDPVPRQGGESKYSIGKLIKFSLHALLSFSNMPLQLGLFAGGISALIGFGVMVYSIYNKIAFGAPQGYSTLIVTICLMSAMQFFIMGIIGEYIGILFQEIKGRPIYIIKDVIAMDKEMPYELPD